MLVKHADALAVIEAALDMIHRLSVGIAAVSSMTPPENIEAHTHLEIMLADAMYDLREVEKLTNNMKVYEVKLA